MHLHRRDSGRRPNAMQPRQHRRHSPHPLSAGESSSAPYQQRIQDNRQDDRAQEASQLDGHVLGSLPLVRIVSGQLTVQRSILPLAERVTRLHQRMNLARTFINHCALAVAQITLHIVLVAVAIRPMNLHCVVGGTEAGIRGVPLGLRGLARVAPALVREPALVKQEQLVDRITDRQSVLYTE